MTSSSSFNLENFKMKTLHYVPATSDTNQEKFPYLTSQLIASNGAINNSTPTNGDDDDVIDAVPVSFKLPDDPTFNGPLSIIMAKGGVKVRLVIFPHQEDAVAEQSESNTSHITTVTSPPKRRKPLKTSVIVGTSDINFRLDEDERNYIQAMDEQRMEREQGNQNASKHLSLSQRLEGWTLESRQRNKNSIIDKFYIHRSSNTTFRSMVEVHKFIMYESYPATKKNCFRPVDSQESVLDNNTEELLLEEEPRAIQEMIEELLDTKNEFEAIIDMPQSG